MRLRECAPKTSSNKDTGGLFCKAAEGDDAGPLLETLHLERRWPNGSLTSNSGPWGLPASLSAFILQTEAFEISQACRNLTMLWTCELCRKVIFASLEQEADAHFMIFAMIWGDDQLDTLIVTAPWR